MDEAVDFILKAISSVKKPQRLFMTGLLFNVAGLPG